MLLEAWRQIQNQRSDKPSANGTYLTFLPIISSIRPEHIAVLVSERYIRAGKTHYLSRSPLLSEGHFEPLVRIWFVYDAMGMTVSSSSFFYPALAEKDHFSVVLVQSHADARTTVTEPWLQGYLLAVSYPSSSQAHSAEWGFLGSVQRS